MTKKHLMIAAGLAVAYWYFKRTQAASAMPAGPILGGMVA